jgi:hypothetical protein
MGPFFDLPSHASYRIRRNADAPTGIPILDEEMTSTGAANSNNLQYIGIADVFGKDMRFLLRRYPDAYLRGVKRALTQGYFHAATNDIWGSQSHAYKSIAPVDTRLNDLLGVRKDGRLGVLLWVLPLTVAYAIGRLLSRRARASSQRSITPVVAVVVVTIFYVTLSTTLISWDDFSRYRFEIDVFFLLLFSLLLEDAARVLATLPARVRDLTVLVRGFRVARLEAGRD